MQDGTGVRFPVGLNSLRLNSPCYLSVKPGILAACIAPHQYLSGAAVSPPVCLHRTLRPKGSMPASYRHGDFPSIPSLRFVAHSASFPTNAKDILNLTRFATPTTSRGLDRFFPYAHHQRYHFPSSMPMMR